MPVMRRYRFEDWGTGVHHGELQVPVGVKRDHTVPENHAGREHSEPRRYRVDPRHRN
ncbi:hypothetical protein LCGC14_1043100 [marine sediment metagenome]|uniref:Uncharacterized protein n=1 Tax=marine sediment metagenome TaxID=412755 RepID=A0A0F9NCX6_9ZZZZ